jgi:hypothetical protein
METVEEIHKTEGLLREIVKTMGDAPDRCESLGADRCAELRDGIEELSDSLASLRRRLLTILEGDNTALVKGFEAATQIMRAQK